MESPCVDVCEIETASGLCKGCRRTLDEIARWSSMSDDERRGVMLALPARRLQSDSVGAGRPARS
ncbi:MAG: DUF1289 domain-containing protein [Hyphomicrobiaceae bacterium]